MNPPRVPKQEQEPARTEVDEVAAGILRMQLPISMPGLGHVNTYALVDRDGVTVVDPGLPGPRSWRALRARLGQAELPLNRVHEVVITHSHPDHYGGAAQLAKRSGAAIVAHRDWAESWLRAAGHTDGCPETGGDPSPAPATRPAPPWARPTPWGGAAFRPPRRRRLAYAVAGRLMRNLWSPPVPERRVGHGEVLRLAGRDWVAKHTPGHTADHLCLYDPEAKVLLSGDHVLPTITPHISGASTEADPLASFLASLDAVAALDVDLVLPAHGHPFTDLKGRVADIREHHDRRLASLVEASQERGWASVADLSQAVFRPRSWGPMAESETYAHLEHLRHTGRGERRPASGGLEYLIDR